VKRLLLVLVVLLVALGVAAAIWAAGSDGEQANEPCPPARITVEDPTTSRMMTYTNPCDGSGPVRTAPSP
jgi:hypothetical protein